MFHTIVSRSNTMSLDEVIERLSRQDVVSGVVVNGSGGAEEIVRGSDYDLVVFRTDLDTEGHVGLTYIDGRVTDVIFVNADETRRILALKEPLSVESWTGHVVHWLVLGRVAYDRTGEITRAFEYVHRGHWLRPMDDAEIYQIWFSINFNVRHNHRILNSDDPLYMMALDVRMLYGATDIFRGYFHCRRMLWEGEKAALRYLQEHDPGFIALFQRFVHTDDREQKMIMYEQLADWATAPVGGVWDPQGTSMQLIEPQEKVTPDMIDRALRFWEDLLGDE